MVYVLNHLIITQNTVSVWLHMKISSPQHVSGVEFNNILFDPFPYRSVEGHV